MENLAGLRVEQQRVVKSLPSNAVKPNGKSLANVNEDANYYLDYVDLPYGLDFSTRSHIASKVEFGNDGKVFFPNMLYGDLFPDSKIVGTFDEAHEQITIENGQKIGTLDGVNIVLCRAHVNVSDNNMSIDYDKDNPLVLKYDKGTEQIMVNDVEDSYLALFDENFQGCYAIASSFNYIPASFIPAPTIHDYSYVDYNWETHKGTVSMINMNIGNQEVIYIQGLFTEQLKDNSDNVIADYGTSWLQAYVNEEGFVLPTLQTIAPDIAIAMINSNMQLYTGGIQFSYDQSTNEYVQSDEYQLCDVFSDGQNLGFTTTHSDSRIAKTGTSSIQNTVTNDESKEVVSTEYFDLSGRRINNIQKGAGIMVMKYIDGTSKAVKVVKE